MFRSWPDSLWLAERTDPPQSSVADRSTADVIIVGAGYTGLWSAIFIKEQRPDLDVVIIDAVAPGYGASGRNGGWCSGLLPIDMASLVALHGRDAASTMQQAAIASVVDVGRYVTENKIDCDWRFSGSVTAATNPAQLERAKQAVVEAQAFGLTDHDLRVISVDELRDRVRIHGAIGGTFTPHCAVVHPMKLVNGLSARARSLGVRFALGLRVGTIDDAGVTGDFGNTPIRLRAPWVVRATEAFTPAIKAQHRHVVPLYSYMIATEPLSEGAWSEIGWTARETLAEGRHMVTYAQRTADGRIAFGGRGAGYRFASRVASHFDVDPRVHDRIVESMHTLFPATRNSRVTHRWGGPLALPRDWHPSVTIDRATRRIRAGGYVGDGVALAHLAGRTVAAAITGVDSADLALPIARHISRNWEPEPLRFIGINSALRLPLMADAIERRTRRPARRTIALMNRTM